MTSTITVTGSGSASAAPDAMRLLVAVRTTAISVPRALARVAAGVDRLGEVARTFTSADRIASHGLSVWPQHTESEGDVFQATHMFEIFCESLEKSGELVTALAEALQHELGIESVEPVIADASGLARRARELAFDDARSKAAEMAALAGRSLGEVEVIVEEGGYERPMALAASSGSGGMPFEPGSSKVTARVRVTWQLA